MQINKCTAPYARMMLLLRHMRIVCTIVRIALLSHYQFTRLPLGLTTLASALDLHFGSRLIQRERSFGVSA